jgi:hypothetical protein
MNLPVSFDQAGVFLSEVLIRLPMRYILRGNKRMNFWIRPNLLKYFHNMCLSVVLIQSPPSFKESPLQTVEKKILWFLQLIKSQAGTRLTISWSHKHLGHINKGSKKDLASSFPFAPFDRTFARKHLCSVGVDL